MNELTIKDFPLNIFVTKILNNKVEDKTIEPRTSIDLMCIEHNKPADLICTTDHEPICVDCVLFARHKGHTYQKQDEFIEKIK